MNGPRYYLRRTDTLWWARRTYLAYTLREGVIAVFVEPFPATGDKVQISKVESST